MKLKSAACVFLVLTAIAIRLPAQQNEADRKLFDETKAKAEKGDAHSQAVLAEAFEDGKLGVVKDEAEAVKWYRKAAEQNVVEAQFNLGICYSEGRGVTKDYVQAAKWYRRAAELNDADAQLNLGICYEKGRGVAKDEVEAVKWFRKAAEQNDAFAQCCLGFCYADGEGVEKEEVEAVKWWRKAADQNLAPAQYELGLCYCKGRGVAKDNKEALKWFRLAAEQENARGQNGLGFCYANGQGVAKDEVEAVKWFRKSAEQNYAPAELTLGARYSAGSGVPKDEAEAVKWYRKAAEQNDAIAQYALVLCYCIGDGVAKDYVEGYKWCLLAAGQGNEDANKAMNTLENKMTGEQIAEGQKLARNFKPREVPSAGGDISIAGIMQTRPDSSGSGFFITEDGYLISNYHVVKDAAQVRLVTSAGLIAAKVVRVDAANDLALLKAEGSFTPLPVTASRTAHLGCSVATIGFPNPGLQGFAPKFARGEIAALSGAGDDARYFQISVPVQPGNSGGALVDEHGNVVGVVSAKLDASAALAASGALPENVNYAIKSSFVLSFLESSPDVSAKLKEPITAVRKFDDVVQSAQQAAVLVLVY